MNKKHSEMPICAMANIIPLLLSVSIEFKYFWKILKFLTLSVFAHYLASWLLCLGTTHNLLKNLTPFFYLKWKNHAKKLPKTANPHYISSKTEIQNKSPHWQSFGTCMLRVVQNLIYFLMSKLLLHSEICLRNPSLVHISSSSETLLFCKKAPQAT